jgi:predicted secreted Zn-dependent protease
MKYWLLWCLLLGGIPPAQAGPTINTHYKYYWIYPKNKQDLGKALDKQSPIISNGQKYRGHTQWQVNWHYWWYENPNSCKITKVKTALTVTYTLPRIAENYRVDAETRQSFDRYWQALFNHEQNHKNSGLLAARAIEKALLNLVAFPTCQQLQTTANQIGNNWVQKYRQRDVEYDRHTDHGRKEGVMLTN